MREDKFATEAPFRQVAPAFHEMANRMIYASMATVDSSGRPRTRIVHTLWEWDGERLVGWIGSFVTKMKKAHLARNPYVSCGFWAGAEVYDTCTAECRAELLLDEESKRRGWELFKSTPEPLGYDPATIHPAWADGPTSESWGVIRLEPWYLHVFPATFARSGGKEGAILTWREGEEI